MSSLYHLLNESDKVLLVSGMGGVGKTTIARALLDHHQNKYTHYAWVNGRLGIKEAMVNDFQLINSLDLFQEILKIRGDLQADATDACFEVIISRLRDLDKFGLLIIDDIGQDQQMLIDSLNLKSNWKVLVTSRELLSNFEIFKLDVLQEDSAVQLFIYYAEGSNYNAEQLQAARNIVNSVWRHTLSIELLGKTIAGNKELDVTGLEKILVDHGIKAIPDHLIGTVYLEGRENGSAIETTAKECLSIAFDLSPVASNTGSRYLLSVFSVLPPVPVSYQTLKEILDISADKATAFQNLLKKLTHKSWLTETDGSYYMHPVIQEVVRERLRPTPQSLETLIAFLTRKSDDYHLLQLEELVLYNAFIRNLIQYFQQVNLASGQIASLTYYYAVLLRNIGKPAEALNFHKTALRSREANGTENAAYAESLCGIAACQIDLNELDDAEQTLQKVLAIQEKVLDSKDFNIAISHHNLSVIYKKKSARNPDCLKDAVSETGITISILENQPDHADKLAIALTQKGQLLKRMKMYQEAIDAFDQVRLIRVGLFGPDAKETFRADEEKALVYKELEDFETGFALISGALPVFEKAYAEDSLKLAMPYHNGAFLAFKTGHKSLAIEWQLKSVSIFSGHLKPGDPQRTKAEEQLRFFLDN